MEEEMEIINPDQELPFGDFTEVTGIVNGKDQALNIANNAMDASQNILYYNLFRNGKFSINKLKNRNAEYSLRITDEFHNGELLMFYDNGKINKVQVQGFIKKQLDKTFALGKCRDQTLINLELAKSKIIVGICYTSNDEKFFKAHLTSRMKPNNRDLKLQGKKIIYDNFDSIKYKTLPLKVENELGTLLMKSFQSSGKSMKNKRYKKEWDILKSLWPEIFY